jgi:hypothetical protein
MVQFTKREQLIIGFLVLTALILAVARYCQARKDLALHRRGEVLRVIEHAKP